MTRAVRTSGDIRRIQIKQAAKEIIFQNGLQNLSTRNIAAKVGISEGTIFRHFGTKKDIFFDLLHDIKSELCDPLFMISHNNRSPEERLYEYFCYHINYLLLNKGITILFFTEASYQNSDELKPELSKLYLDLKQNFAKILSDGIEAGIWHHGISVNDLAGLYMGIPVTLTIEFTLNNEGFNEKDFCDTMHRLFMKILEK